VCCSDGALSRTNSRRRRISKHENQNEVNILQLTFKTFSVSLE
jgi:hypothetical protein